MSDTKFVIPLEAMRATIKTILEHPLGFEWTVQGFGFVRTYFGGKRYRLNVWDSRLATNASTIHDHPWSLRAWIMSGWLYNRRFVEEIPIPSPTHSFGLLRTGVGGGMTDETGVIRLRAKMTEIYKVGDTYQQGRSEIHETEYTDGTVTLNERVGDTEMARVFWPYGTEWQDAMPRIATEVEILAVTENALHGWRD